MEFKHVLEIINNWRAAHAYPLNTFQIYLRRKVASVDNNALVAQRIKRLASIEQKLRIMPKLKLSEMQDIGGCRAVVESVAKVNQLVSAYGKSDLKHRRIDYDDYIRKPKKSGYRSYHLIYRYRSDKQGGMPFNGRKIEVQLRTRLQHSWATAVETVGTFTRQALKSSIGGQDWLRFFQLMGTVMALEEGTSPVPNTPTDKSELLRELRDCANNLQVETKLSAYGAAMKQIGRPRGRSGRQLYLLILDTNAQTITLRGYSISHADEAFKDYSETEQMIRSKTGDEAVLVSVDSVNMLRGAYPNYFLDTEVFRSKLKMALQGEIGKV